MNTKENLKKLLLLLIYIMNGLTIEIMKKKKNTKIKSMMSRRMKKEVNKKIMQAVIMKMKAMVRAIIIMKKRKMKNSLRINIKKMMMKIINIIFCF